MDIKGWHYYNHAALPSTPPREEVNLEPIKDGSIWQMSGAPLLARWTSDFDCGYETNWWYVIKDTPFDISSIKSNYRYKITKGTKNFEVKVIDPVAYKEEMYRVQEDAFSLYPVKYRPVITKQAFFEEISSISQAGKNVKIFGAFSQETGELCGYTKVPFFNGYAVLEQQKVRPSCERLQINAALVYGVLQHLEDALKVDHYYFSDGSRNIQHETAFQDYLEKYFGFRKAYCKLHVAYNPKIKTVVNILYPFRNILQKLDGNKLVHKINGVLKMEHLVRGGSV